MIEVHAGVQHRDDDAGAAARARPGGLDVDGRTHAGGGRAQVPLAAGGAVLQRAAVAAALGAAGGVQRVVRRRHEALAAVGLGVGHVGVGGQAARQRDGVHALCAEHLCAAAHGRAGLQRTAQAQAQAVGALLQHALRLRRGDPLGHGVPAQHLGAGLEADDHLGSRRRPGGWRGRGQQKGRQGGGQLQGDHGGGRGAHRRSVGARGRPRHAGPRRAVTHRAGRPRPGGVTSTPSRAPSRAPCSSSPTRCRTRPRP